MQKTTQCVYCRKDIAKSPCQDCADVLYDICATTMKKKTNQQSIFEQVDNLVFQGGGVKGIAYLGVLQQLHQYNENLLSNVKRIAGTSAGAIVALYLGLNKDINDIAKLLQDSDYSKLLDDGPTYSVNVSSFWWDSKFTGKEIIMKMLDYLKIIKNFFQVTKDQKEKDTRLKNIIEAIVSYVASKFGWYDQIVIRAVAWWVMNKIVAWFSEAFLTEPRDPRSEKSQAEAAERARRENAEFQKKLKELTEQVLDEIDELKKKYEEQNPPQKQHAPTQKKSSLDDETTLLYAITELLWSGVEVNPESDPQKKEYGIFAADKIKESLIEKPIFDSLKAVGKETQYKAGEITFGELASITKGGKPAFRPFFICSWNTATYRIDIFSAEHTPNVLVADAVRASMSIPLFFKSVTVREKVGGVISRLRAFTPAGSFPIIYMDGGIMSNYPVWMFDDLKYCMPETSQKWPANHKANIQNPNTLGFRLIDLERIDIYRRPYYDFEGKHLKLVQEDVNIGDTMGVIKFITSVNIGEHEENGCAQRGDYFRTAYIYNCNISAVEFKLSPEQQNLLIAAGQQSVLSLKERAEAGFEGELGSYFTLSKGKREDDGKQPEQQNVS